LIALNVPETSQSPRQWQETQCGRPRGHQLLHRSVTEPRQTMGWRDGIGMRRPRRRSRPAAERWTRLSRL